MDRQIFHKQDAIDREFDELFWDEKKRADAQKQAIAELRRATEIVGVSALPLIGAAVFVVVLGVARFGVGR